MIDRSNGTNGKLNIDEILEKDPLIEELLDGDEVIEYISYEKGILYKFWAMLFLIVFVAFIKVLIPTKEVSWHQYIVAFMIFLIFPIFQLIEGKVSKLIITNKGVIIRSSIKWEGSDKALCTDKFSHSDIKEVGWSDYRFHNHLKIKVKNRKNHHRFYPQGPNITEEEAILLVDLIEKKMKGVDKKWSQ